MRLFLVDFVGVEGFFVIDEVEVDWGLEGEADGAVEAGAAAGVAGSGALLGDVEDEGVLIAVGADFVDDLGVA